MCKYLRLTKCHWDAGKDMDLSLSPPDHTQGGGQELLASASSKRKTPGNVSQSHLLRGDRREICNERKSCAVLVNRAVCARGHKWEESHKRKGECRNTSQQKHSTCPSHLPPHHPLQMLPSVAWPYWLQGAQFKTIASRLKFLFLLCTTEALGRISITVRHLLPHHKEC